MAWGGQAYEQVKNKVQAATNPTRQPTAAERAAGYGGSTGGSREPVPTGTRTSAPAPAPAPTRYSGGGGGGEASTDGYAVAQQQVDDNPNLRNASEAEVIAWIKENYSPSMSRLLDEPELRAAIIKAARENMSPDRAMVEIEKTNWWQSRNETQRTIDTLKLTDPNEYQRQLDRQVAEITTGYLGYGIDGDMRQIAEEAMRMGYSDAQIRGIMADRLAAEAGKDGLDVGSTGAADSDRFMAIARNEYLTLLPRSETDKWAVRALREGADVEDEFRQYMSTIVSPMYGIDPASGITPGSVMAPVRGMIAQQLEIDPDSIDLLSDEWAEVLQVPTENGGFRHMTQYEALQYARSKPGWAKTKGANAETAQIVDNIGRKFGAWV